MRIVVVIAAILAAVAVTIQPTAAAESGGKLVIKTKSVPPRAPIEDKTKQAASKQQAKTQAQEGKGIKQKARVNSGL